MVLSINGSTIPPVTKLVSDYLQEKGITKWPKTYFKRPVPDAHFRNLPMFDFKRTSKAIVLATTFSMTATFGIVIGHFWTNGYLRWIRLVIHSVNFEQRENDRNGRTESLYGQIRFWHIQVSYFFFVDLRFSKFLQDAWKIFKFTENSSWRIFADFRYLFIISLVQSVKINNCLNHDGPLFTAAYRGRPSLTTWETCLGFSKVISVDFNYSLTPSRFVWIEPRSNWKTHALWQ